MNIFLFVLQNVKPIDPSPIVNVFLQYGIVGVILLLCIIALYLQNKSHKEERKELNKRIDAVVKSHQDDLRQHGHDRADMMERFNSFANDMLAFARQNK